MDLKRVKEITVKLELRDAKECLKYLPSNLKKVRSKIEEAIENVNFWNFLRNCGYLEFIRDFHLMTPDWHLYCKHSENKGGKEGLDIQGLSEKVKDKIVGTCDGESCPMYRQLF